MIHWKKRETYISKLLVLEMFTIKWPEMYTYIRRNEHPFHL